MNVTLHSEPIDQTQSERCYQKAVSKLRSGDHVAAVDLFTSAIGCDPNNVLYYVGRGEALLKSECFRRALEDALEAIRLDPSGPLAYKAHEISGTALFRLGQYREAKEEFRKSIRSLDCPPAQKSLSQWLYFCDEKIARLEKFPQKVIESGKEEMQKKESVPDKSLLENDAMQIPSIKEDTLSESSKSMELKVPSKKPAKYTWYQTELDVVVEVLIRQLVSNQVDVSFSEKKVDIVIKDLKEDSIMFSLTLMLNQSIVVEKSSHKILPSKLEIRLKKRDTKYWPDLEFSTDIAKQVRSKSWNIPDGEEEEGVGEEIHKLFQQIYLAADDDTRRAMNKSFQESAGTVLSTDWPSIKRRKVEVATPDGMELKQWN